MAFRRLLVAVSQDIILLFVLLFWCSFYGLSFICLLFDSFVLHRVRIDHRFVLHLNIILFLFVVYGLLLIQVKTFIGYKVKTKIFFLLLILSFNLWSFRRFFFFFRRFLYHNFWLWLLLSRSRSFCCNLLRFGLRHINTLPSCTFSFCANDLCFCSFLSFFAAFWRLRGFWVLILIAFSWCFRLWWLLWLFDSLFKRSFCIPLLWFLFLCLLIFLFIWLWNNFFRFTLDRYFFLSWLLRLSFGSTIVARKGVVFEVRDFSLRELIVIRGKKFELTRSIPKQWGWNHCSQWSHPIMTCVSGCLQMQYSSGSPTTRG